MKELNDDVFAPRNHLLFIVRGWYRKPWLGRQSFNPRLGRGSSLWAGSSAWYAGDVGQAEERPVCKTFLVQ